MIGELAALIRYVVVYVLYAPVNVVVATANVIFNCEIVLVPVILLIVLTRPKVDQKHYLALMEIKETKMFSFAFKVQRVGKDGKVLDINYNLDAAAETKKEALKLVISDAKNVIAQAEEELKTIQ
jgi:hypothetical protein